MSAIKPFHGGADSMPDPSYDFSSNANPVGPCPSVLAAVRKADVTRYPDPAYAQLRAKLADHHRTSADRIVVGSGASELILRLIRHHQGTVQQIVPTFSEYARGAHLCDRRLLSMRTPAAFLRSQARQPGLGFICWPNNPTGDLWSVEFIAEAAASGPLVVDLAYASLCGVYPLATIEAATRGAYRLYSPNKSFGLTGVRGAYLVTPRIDRRLAHDAPSWVIGRDAVALLEAAVEPPARAWLDRTIPRIARWRSRLACSLRQIGLQVREGPATFLLVNVRDASRVTRRLRLHDVRVRDGSSFGLPEWIRLSAQPPRAQKALLVALRDELKRAL